MEPFVDVHRHLPVAKIEIAEGETKILGLKKFKMGNSPDVKVATKDPAVAFCAQAVHLKDTTKLTYRDEDPKHQDDKYYWRHMSSFKNEVTAVEEHNRFFFQISGQSAGQTELEAKFQNTGTNTNPDYARSVSIVVTKNKKRLTLAPAKGSHVPTFGALWKNHPLNSANGPAVHYPCNESPDKTTLSPKSPLGTMQCMVRLCVALEKTGVSFVGLRGSKCNLHGAEHAHHFSNPYDFEQWQRHQKNSHYLWEAKPPLQPEPMPGIAAAQFMYKRHGIVMFYHYFVPPGEKFKPESMWGGHIDLWNENRMGNTFDFQNPWEGEAAFYRSKKIFFWPLD